MSTGGSKSILLRLGVFFPLLFACDVDDQTGRNSNIMGGWGMKRP